MISLTDDIHVHWVDTLRTLVAETSDRAVAEIKPSDPDLIWIRQLWPAGSKVIDMGTALGLCRSIGLSVPKQMQSDYKVS
jgi:phosphatidylinositol phospholipase C delta